MVMTSTGPSGRSASITSSASTSGAEAPADADRGRAAHVFRRQLGSVCDQVARDARLLADFAQAIGVRAVLCADHEQYVDVLAQLAHRRLAVLRGVADV